jgi:hypothetical protein
MKHLSGERTGLSFTIAAGPCQRSHSQVRVQWESWPHFTVSDSRLPQPRDPGPRIESSRVESYVTTDSQSASLVWNKVPTWVLRPDFYYCQIVASLLMWGALSDERTGLSFTTAAGPRQRSHSRVRIPWDLWPYFTVSDSRLYDSRRYGGGIRPRLHTGTLLQFSAKSSYLHPH